MKLLLRAQEEKIALLESIQRCAKQQTACAAQRITAASASDKHASDASLSASSPPASQSVSWLPRWVQTGEQPWSRWLSHPHSVPPSTSTPDSYPRSPPRTLSRSPPRSPPRSQPLSPPRSQQRSQPRSQPAPLEGGAVTCTPPPPYQQPAVDVGDWTSAHTAARRLQHQLATMDTPSRTQDGGSDEAEVRSIAKPVSARSVETFLESFLSAVAPSGPPVNASAPPSDGCNSSAARSMGCSGAGGAHGGCDSGSNRGGISGSISAGADSATAAGGGSMHPRLNDARGEACNGAGACAVDVDGATMCASRRGMNIQPCVVTLGSTHLDDHVSLEPSPPVTSRVRLTGARGTRKGGGLSSEATSLTSVSTL
jgi:hypothetical protein